jgi:beta-glucosidase
LYVSAKNSRVFRPVKELRAFEKIFLQKKEKATIVMELGSRDFAFFDFCERSFITEECVFEIMIGASSRDIRLTGIVETASDVYCDQ